MNARVAPALAGRRVAVTRAADQATEVLQLLHVRGAVPLACPTIDIARPVDDYAALDASIRSVDRYKWVAFTSQNAVAAFANRLDILRVRLPDAIRLAAVGTATARALTDRLRAPDFVPSTALAESLANEIGDIVNRQVLFPRGDLASETFGRLLRSRGATVDEVIAYRTVPGSGTRQLADLVRSREVDAILFMSASSVRYLLDALDDTDTTECFTPQGPAVICIGPETARVAREAGIEVSAIAAVRTAGGAVDALEQWFGRDDDGKGS
jgi:uroporphyrinogen-III synthase